MKSVRKLWIARIAVRVKRVNLFFRYAISHDYKTRPTVNLAERRLLSDMVGDYLRAYDETVTDIEGGTSNLDRPSRV